MTGCAHILRVAIPRPPALINAIIVRGVRIPLKFDRAHARIRRCRLQRPAPALVRSLYSRHGCFRRWSVGRLHVPRALVPCCWERRSRPWGDLSVPRCRFCAAHAGAAGPAEPSGRPRPGEGEARGRASGPPPLCRSPLCLDSMLGLFRQLRTDPTRARPSRTARRGFQAFSPRKRLVSSRRELDDGGTQRSSEVIRGHQVI